MMSFPAELPPDIAGCHAMIRGLLADREHCQELTRQQAATIAAHEEALAKKDQKLAEQEQTIAEQQATIDQLVVDLALFKRFLFGSRRERYLDDPRQGVLFESAQLPADQEAATAERDEPPAESKPGRTSKGRGRRVFPDFLPRTPVHHTLAEDEIPADLRNDPTAKRFFKKTSETLEYEPPKLHVVEHYQEVIARDEPDGETTMITARRPPPLIDSFAGPGLLAYLTTSRFADHLPYYRQEDVLSRYRFRIERSTQWRWMSALAERLGPLVDLLRQRALQSLVLGVDETPVRMLSLAALGSVKAYLWSTVGDRAHPYDCFYFTVDRARAGPEAFLSGFRGYLLSDAYVCYERIALASDDILKVGCWVHARRKFEEVHYTAASVRTHTALGYFQRLYDIEDRARSLDDEQRYELRQQEAKPIVTQFHQWLVEQYERELPKSKLRGAIGYMVNRWEAFERYLEHGAIPIDNNRTEASLKYAILGRKAWLFFGNERGGKAAASLFTLTKSCNRHRIDPYAYLRDVYTRWPTLRESELETLLPDRWLEEHPEHRIQERVDEAHERASRTRARRAARRRQLLRGR
jgi:transposase